MKTRIELEEMGQKVLGSVITELYLSMHFMGSALNSLDYKMDLLTRTVGTDAVYIRYNPTYLLQMYVERPDILNRTYMHMLMHCLFRHMYSAKEYEDSQLWDLCCDIAAESVVDSMDYPTILRVTSDLREEWYSKLKEEIGVLTAEKIYHYFILKKRDPYEEESLRQEFELCDHSFWERMEPPEDEKRQDEKKEIMPPPMLLIQQKEKEWDENAKRIQSELEMNGQEGADEKGSLEWLLKIQNKSRRSYTEFLKKFAVLREEITLDLDSFDYGFYMYGLETYGNMPLIEENEYAELRKVEELVIAIDTSASCKETKVQKFLNETAAILKNQENFFKKVNIYIIECDDQIQQVIHIDELSDMEKYAKAFSVKGGYGTDFRPVFELVDDMISSGKIKNLMGLMYFTDGRGKYPTNAVGYDVAFVIDEENEIEEIKVPKWALKVYL